jgi:hypothetical protein
MAYHCAYSSNEVFIRCLQIAFNTGIPFRKTVCFGTTGS